mgnify:CR=1 FL=1
MAPPDCPNARLVLPQNGTQPEMVKICTKKECHEHPLHENGLSGELQQVTKSSTKSTKSSTYLHKEEELNYEQMVT